jgi:WD40 repeat protein/serine/threonine protein kinase
MDATPACPSREQLRQLIAEELSSPECSVVESHVESCPACKHILEQLTEVSYPQWRPSELEEGVGLASPTPVPYLDALRDQAPKSMGSRGFRLMPMPETSPGSDPDEAWPDLSGYEVVEVLGRGGMGLVYKARQQKLNRWVALKMLRGGKYAEPERRARFRAEAQAVAQLQHPNIVQIYEVGESDGLPYLVLELVEGGSLAQRIQDGPWAVDQAAQLLETLARAAHFAHQHGVIHRDLKPANILLESVVRSPWSVAKEPGPSTTSYGLRTTDYGLTPKITDFGLAKQLDVDANQTNTGVVVGTPGYMAPEQAEGRTKDVGPATDVHALGIILYELLTGRPPFQGASTLQTLEQVRHHEPVPPRRLQPGVPRDLETICLKCLNKEPQRRYASAQDLAEDLRRLREGRAIKARPAGFVEQGWKWTRRKPALAALLLVSALVTLVGFPGVTWLWLQAKQERQAKEQQRLRAEQERQAKEQQRLRADQEAQKALVQAYRGNLAAAQASFGDHNAGDAAQYLQAAPPALRSWEWRQLSSRLDDRLAAVRLADSEVVIRLCQPGSGIVTAGNHQVRLWDALTGACLGTLTNDCSHGLAVVPTAKRTLLLVENRARTRLRLYTPPMAIGTPGRDLPVALGGTVAGLTMDAEATRLGVRWNEQEQSRDYFFTVFELGVGNRRVDFKGHQSGIFGLAFSPDGTRIASGSADGTVGIWDTATGRKLTFLRGTTQRVDALVFSPDGSRLLVGSSDGTVRQWDAHTGRSLDVWRGHKDRVESVAYSPDGRWMASGSRDRTVRLWKSAEKSEPAVLLGHTGVVQQVAFSPDSRWLASTSEEDRTARVWELVSRDEICCLRGHQEWIYPVAYSPDGALLASGGWDKTVRLWDAATGERLAVLPHTEWVASLAFSPDGAWLVAGEWKGSIRIWDTATAQLKAAWIAKGELDIAKGVAVSPDGTRVVVAYDAQTSLTPQVRNRETGQVVGLLHGQTSGVLGVTYSPDGQQLATAGRDGTVRLWDARTYELSAIWRGHGNVVNSVAYSADGRLLVSASEDKTLRVWEVATGDCRAILRGHADIVYTAVFHPDGTRIVSGARDRFLRFWDMATGEEVARFPGHTSWVFSLAFSPDRTTLASGSGDGTVRLWDTAPLARRLQARQLSLALRPEAERIVARLFEELHEPSQVVQALRTDSPLSDGLRGEALKVVLRRSMKEPR